MGLALGMDRAGLQREELVESFADLKTSFKFISPLGSEHACSL